jgi:hypothetical protein
MALLSEGQAGYLGAIKQINVLPDIGEQAFETVLQNIVIRCPNDTRGTQRGRILCEFETVRYTKMLMKSDFVGKI